MAQIHRHLSGPAILPVTMTHRERCFHNPIAEGADPWVVFHEGSYFWCFSAAGRGVFIYRSDRLTSLGERHRVWSAPATGPHSQQVWAPELHLIDGCWYIYTTASDGDNASHRVIVLASETGSPLGPYRLKATLYTGDQIETLVENRWAIDATVLTREGRHYLIWSGWEAAVDEQWLYIAPMANPWTVSGNRIKLCANDDHVWERVDESLAGRGLNEAPQVLERHGRTFVVFSASGSWQPSYKLGLMELTGADPLDPASWTKFSEPVFVATGETWGVGHGCFTRSPDGQEDWHVYHAKENRGHNWERSIFLQRFEFTPAGLPNFGCPVARHRDLEIPSGQPVKSQGGAYATRFEHGWSEWDYYGHQDLIVCDEAGLRLGDFGEHLAMYRSGEKLILRDRGWDQWVLSMSVTLAAPGSCIGILFGVETPSLGFAGQTGAVVELTEEGLGFAVWENGQRRNLREKRGQFELGRPHTLTFTLTPAGLKMKSPFSGLGVQLNRTSLPGKGIGIRLERGRCHVHSFSVAPIGV